MEEKITGFAARLEPATTGICVVVIMSHGSEKGIFTKDNKFITYLWIQEQFSNANCKNLFGIPKIFFFQACRQTKLIFYYNFGLHWSVPIPDFTLSLLASPDFQQIQFCGRVIKCISSFKTATCLTLQYIFSQAVN